VYQLAAWKSFTDSLVAVHLVMVLIDELALQRLLGDLGLLVDLAKNISRNGLLHGTP